MDPSIDNSTLFADSGVAASISQPSRPDKDITVLFDLHSLNEMSVLTEKPQVTIDAADLEGYDLLALTITVTDKYPESKLIKPLPDGAGLIIAGLKKV